MSLFLKNKQAWRRQNYGFNRYQKHDVIYNNEIFNLDILNVKDISYK